MDHLDTTQHDEFKWEKTTGGNWKLSYPQIKTYPPWYVDVYKVRSVWKWSARKLYSDSITKNINDHLTDSSAKDEVIDFIKKSCV